MIQPMTTRISGSPSSHCRRRGAVGTVLTSTGDKEPRAGPTGAESRYVSPRGGAAALGARRLYGRTWRYVAALRALCR